MTSRRPWAALSVAYQRRLERGGITQTAYESGAALTGARGHRATPEHPQRAEKNAARYLSYIRARVKPMRVPTSEGVKIVTIPSAAGRSAIGTYDNAVKNMLGGKPWHQYGQDGGTNLPDFTNTTIHGFVGDSDELQTMELLTDERELTARYYTGELRYEQIYAETS